MRQTWHTFHALILNFNRLGDICLECTDTPLFELAQHAWSADDI